MLLQRLLGHLNLNSLRSGRPPAAVEITTSGVLAAARDSARESIAYSYQSLPPGAVIPSTSEHNLRALAPVTNAIRSTLEQVCSGSNAVTIVLPDLTTRVLMLEFDALPAKNSEAVEIIRFRLRKLVPFSVENAKIGYQLLQPQGTRCRVLVAVTPNAILSEYEDAVRMAGYKPGAVLPAGLAALGALQSSEPVLSACLSDRALITAISHSGDVLLYRVHELPDDPAQRLSEVQTDTAVAAAYFEDTVKSAPQCLRYAGTSRAEEFMRSIALPWLPVADLAPHPENAANIALESVSIAGVTGALAGAR